MQVKFFRTNYTGTFNVVGGFSGPDIFWSYTVYLSGTIGWGLAPSHRITQRGPFQEGDSDIDFRLDPRVLSLPFVGVASSIDEHFRLRNALLNVFKPGNDDASLRLTYDDAFSGTQDRYIDVKVIGGLTMDTDSKDFNVRGVIQLRAADPTWSGGTEFEQQLSSSILGTPTPYPKPYPVPYGADSISRITEIIYGGTWMSYPVITAVGPLTDLVITDGLNHSIKFTTPIPASTYVSINLKYNFKTVTDQDGVNRFSWLSIDSDITNFALFPSPFILDGINTLSVSATGTDGGSLVTINYVPRYIGV